eukprot:gene38687-50823_t
MTRTATGECFGRCLLALGASVSHASPDLLGRPPVSSRGRRPTIISKNTSPATLLLSAETNWPPIAMGQIEDQWINYLNDPIPDESSAEGEALFLASGETDLLPCATKTEYPWMERRATRHGFRLLIVKGEPP